jgi:hypothetical protein
MIVQRGTFRIKPGRMDEAAALVLAEGEKHPPRAFRVYTPHTGPVGILAMEWEFENLAEYERYWAEWDAKPETAAFSEKWNELREAGGTLEIWNLAE